jgi:polysaccharide deactylase WbmS-like protein
LICISFDTDHVDDRRMEEFLSDFRIPGVATFFCTQRYEALDGGPHELCPHPVLEPETDWSEVLDRKQREFPDARGVRPHSCVNTNMLSIDYHRRGFEWVSARELPGQSGIAPYREAWGVWHVPLYYMDTMDFSFGDYWPDDGGGPFGRELLETTTREPGLYVFDFHPIHLMLNSTSAREYLSRRDRFKAGEPIEEIRCEGYGAGEYYADLISLMEEAGVTTVGISEALASTTRDEASPAADGR